MLSASVFQKVQAGLRNILGQGFCEPCCLCERASDRGLCVDCWRQLLSCKQSKPLPTTAASSPLLIWGCYEGSLKRAIAQMKYHNHPVIATRLGEELGLRWLQVFPKLNSFQVIPIPLHHARLAERGYNQAERIAQGFCRVVGVPCHPRGLVRLHQTKAQYLLDPSRRLLNLRGAFAVGTGIRDLGIPVLLIDDIFTTGVTMAEAQRVITGGHMTVLGSAVVAQARLV